MCLSGADQKEAQDKIIAGMKSKYPNAATEVFVASDTHGPIATATASGMYIQWNLLDTKYDFC